MKISLSLVLICYSTLLNNPRIKAEIQHKEKETPVISETVNKPKKFEALKNNINSINVINLRASSHNICNIELSNYFGFDVSKLKTYQIKNLHVIYQLRACWEYLEVLYDIPKYISISFWIQETGWGKSTLFTEHFNFGGIKGYGKNRACDENTLFCKHRSYATLLDGLAGFGHVLTLDRYLSKIETTDPEENIRAYWEGGYFPTEKGVYHRLSHIENYLFNL